MTRDQFSEAIDLLHSEGVSAAIKAWPKLREHRYLAETLAESEREVTELEWLSSRARARVDQVEADLVAAMFPAEKEAA